MERALYNEDDYVFLSDWETYTSVQDSLLVRSGGAMIRTYKLDEILRDVFHGTVRPVEEYRVLTPDKVVDELSLDHHE